MVYKKFCFKGGLTIFLLLGILSGSLPSLFTLLNFQSWNSRSLYIHPFLSERNFKLPLWNIVENSPSLATLNMNHRLFEFSDIQKKKKEISITFFKFSPSKFSLLYIYLPSPREKKIIITSNFATLRLLSNPTVISRIIESNIAPRFVLHRGSY